MAFLISMLMAGPATGRLVPLQQMLTRGRGWRGMVCWRSPKKKPSTSLATQKLCAGLPSYTLIETEKLNRVGLQAWLTDTLARIADHKITRLDELLPWRYAQT